MGIGRSYQKTNIFPDFTCLQNCWLGAQSRLNTSMKFLRPARTYRRVMERAERAIEQCGLTHRRDTRAAAMSYGEQRQLEIGMMLATEPGLLLLDEPLAGLNQIEAGQLADTIVDLNRQGLSIVLIEHNLGEVLRICTRIVVLDNGRRIGMGEPRAVMADPVVRAAYLGEGGGHAAA